MPVLVPLDKLMLMDDGRDLWPDDFAALVAACEANPEDRTSFGILADWLDDHDEPDFARAWRWLHKRPDVLIKTRKLDYKSPPEVRYYLKNLPGSMRYADVEGKWGGGLPSCVAALSAKLKELMAELT